MIVFKRACKLPRPSELDRRARWGSAFFFRLILTASMVCATSVQAASADTGSLSSRHRFLISVLSSRPDRVSGGDALVRVDVPRTTPLTCVRVFRNDYDV